MAKTQPTPTPVEPDPPVPTKRSGIQTIPIGELRPALEIHPFAEAFPLLKDINPEGWEAFVADIKARGVQEPITLYEDKVIDGRNRYLACRELKHSDIEA